jgi:hypothetical protein
MRAEAFGVHELSQPLDVGGRLIAEISVRRATNADRAAVAAEIIERNDPIPDLAGIAIAMQRLADQPGDALLKLCPDDYVAVAALAAASLKGEE